MKDEQKNRDRDEQGRLLPGHGVGVRFGEGQPTNLGGRKRTYLGELLHDHGFNKREIRETVRILMFYNRDECEKLNSDAKQPMVVQIVAGTLLEALESRNWDKIRSMVEMVVGKPHQTKDVNVSTTVTDRRPITIIKSSEIEDVEIEEEEEE